MRRGQHEQKFSAAPNKIFGGVRFKEFKGMVDINVPRMPENRAVQCVFLQQCVDFRGGQGFLDAVASLVSTV